MGDLSQRAGVGKKPTRRERFNASMRQPTGVSATTTVFAILAVAPCCPHICRADARLILRVPRKDVTVALTQTGSRHSTGESGPGRPHVRTKRYDQSLDWSATDGPALLFGIMLRKDDIIRLSQFAALPYQFQHFARQGKASAAGFEFLLPRMTTQANAYISRWINSIPPSIPTAKSQSGVRFRYRLRPVFRPEQGPLRSRWGWRRPARGRFGR